MTDKMLKFVKIGQQTPPKRRTDVRKKDFNEINEKIIHQNSFSKLKKEIKKRFPKLKVELNLISLDSKITKF